MILTKERIDLHQFKQRFKFKKADFIPFLYIFGFSSVYFFWKYYCLFNNGQEFPIVINSDSIYHSNLAYFLNSVGVESLNSNFINPPNGAHPYHYFEGWSIAFFSFLFNTNYWITEECILYPAYAAIILSGTWALIEKFVPLNHFNKFFGLLTVFFSGFFFSSLTESISIFNIKETYAYSYNAIDEFWGLKLSVVYMFALAVILLFIEKKLTKAILVLLCFPILSITLLPGVIVAVSLFILCLIVFKKKLKLEHDFTFLSLLFPISGFVFIIAFYVFLGASTEYISPPTKNDIIHELTSIPLLKDKIMLFIFRILQLIILYFPVIAILLISVFYSKKDAWKENYLKLSHPVFFTILMIICSLSISLMLSFAFGSKAYYFYVSLPFINILSVLIIIVSQDLIRIPLLKWSVRLVLISFLILFSSRTYSIYLDNKRAYWDKYSKEFIDEVYPIAMKIKNKIGLKYEGNAYFNFAVTVDNIDHLGPFTSGFTKDSHDNFVATSFSCIDISKEQLEKTVNKNYVLTAPLYLFTEELKRKKQFVSNEDARLKFIKKNKIELLYLNKDVELDNALKPYVKRQIQDSKSKITFVLFDASKY